MNPDSDDQNIPGLDDLLNSIRGESERDNSSALAVYVPDQREEDLVSEQIDERILALLGLEDVVDIDYATYKTLLREKMMEGRMTDSKLSSEETELLTDEFKRVRGNTGRFKVKKQKINFQSFVDDVKPEETEEQSQPKEALIALPGTAEVKQEPEVQSEEEKEDKIGGIEKFLGGISDRLAEIEKNLGDMLDMDAKELAGEKREASADRIQGEKQKKRKQESKLEKGLKGIGSSITEKVTKPAKNLLMEIIKFFVMIFLGNAVKKLIEFIDNPMMIFNPFINFINGFIGMINNVLNMMFGGIIDPINSMIGFMNGGITNLENAINGIFGLFGEQEEEDKIKLPKIPEAQVPQIPKIPLFEPKEESSSEEKAPPVQGMKGGGLVVNQGPTYNVKQEVGGYTEGGQVTNQNVGGYTEGGQVTNLNLGSVGGQVTNLNVSGFENGGQVTNQNFKGGNTNFSPKVGGFKGGGQVIKNMIGGGLNSISRFFGGGSVTGNVTNNASNFSDSSSVTNTTLGYTGGGSVINNVTDNTSNFSGSNSVTNTNFGYSGGGSVTDNTSNFLSSITNLGYSEGGSVTNNTSNFLGGGSATNTTLGYTGGGSVTNSSTSSTNTNTSSLNVSNFRYEGGGSITSSSGQTITGMGPDTQLIAAQPGEIVMSKKAVQAYGANNLLAMNKEAGGTNIPTRGSIKGFSGGGMVEVSGTGNTVEGTLKLKDAAGKQVGKTYSAISGTYAGMSVPQSKRSTTRNAPMPDGTYSLTGFQQHGPYPGLPGIGHWSTYVNNGSGSIGSRSGLMLHNDIGSNGTLGCIGVELGGVAGTKAEQEFLETYKKVNPQTIKVALGGSGGDSSEVSPVNASTATRAATPDNSVKKASVSSPSAQAVPGPPPLQGTGSVGVLPAPGQQQNAPPNSGTSAGQKQVPSFSSRDHGNTEFIVIKSIYNIVG